MPDEFTTMREIGKQFGVSSHVIGRWLVEIGLRTQYKQPSQEAFAGGYCTRQPMDRGPKSLVIWHVTKTVAALERAGHRQVIRPPTITMPTTTRLIGPFALEQSGVGGHVIVGGDGAKLVWVYGEDTAQKVLRLLNVAYRYRYFD